MPPEVSEGGPVGESGPAVDRGDPAADESERVVERVSEKQGACH